MKTCNVCKGEFEKLLPSIKGDVCEGDYLKINQGDLPIDEYSLQPGEMTKEMVAFEGDVSVRCVEKWKATGKLPAMKKQRRNGGMVRRILIFDAAMVKAFIKDRNKETHLPAVITQSSPAMQNGGASSGMILPAGAMAEMMQFFIEQRDESVARLTGKLFIGIDDLSEVTQLAVSVLKRKITAAEKAGTLQRYSGKQGKAVWRSNDLMQIIGDVEPVDTDAIYGKENFGRLDKVPPGEAENTGSET